MKIELCDVLYNGDEIIGYTRDVIPFLENMIQDLLTRFLEDDMDDEMFTYTIKELNSTIDELKKDDYDLVKITECAMGGFTIRNLIEE